ncbi:siphovirus Gp157 family protein [Viridibacillus sp. NPDC096237]|uniref:siphovirus Gp157 family protein n=1 Tax=Viridibacillus sp. NPDC096237 TaxID=3390721 RepID=UPI003CFD53DE
MAETLYELTSDYMQVLSLLDEGVDVKDTLDALSDAFEVKVENIGKVIRVIQAKEVAIKQEEDRLKARRTVLAKQAENLKKYTFENMKVLDKKKIEGNLFTFSIRKNPAKLQIDDEDEIPFEFLKAVAPQVDSLLVKENLKLGRKVPGARLVQGESLQIK